MYFMRKIKKKVKNEAVTLYFSRDFSLSSTVALDWFGEVGAAFSVGLLRFGCLNQEQKCCRRRKSALI